MHKEYCMVCGNMKSSFQIIARIENSGCCYSCAYEADHPGKFEAYCSSGDHKDYEALGKCLILNASSLSGSEDDSMSREGMGYCVRFGNFLLIEDPFGFINFEEYDSVEKAIKAFSELYDAGMGADELDAWI